MRADDVLKLVDAGFSSEEIRSMMQEPDPAPAPAPAPDPEPAPAPAPAPAPDPVPAPEPAPAPNPSPAPAPDPLETIKQQIMNLSDVVGKIEKSIVMPTIDDVKPAGIDDIVTKFFKEE